MKDINIAMIQTDLYWRNTSTNLQLFSDFLDEVHKKTEIVILPEMFSTGFTMDIEGLQQPTGKLTLEWLKTQSAKHNMILIGSILTEENNKYFNRMYWMRPDGSFDFYDKRHLFHMAGEHKIMTGGEVQKIVEYRGWRFNLQVCYDLRFPVWAKNHYDNTTDKYAYDVLIYIANWPEVRKQAYLPLLQARAIENQSFVIWTNRIGKDGKGIIHSGDTRLIDPYGKVQNKMEAHQQGILYSTLNGEMLQYFRAKFKVGLDWDEFEIV